MKTRNWWKNLNELQRQLYRQLYKKSFYEFAKEFWNEADPQPFVDGKVVQIFCEIAQYFTRSWIGYNEIEVNTTEYLNKGYNVVDVREGKKNVSIAVCPRHSKTMIFSVMFPVWTQTNTPLKAAAISHTSGLAIDINKKRQKIMNSEKFKYFFPEIVLETNTSHSIKTTSAGEMFAIARESATGFGADILTLDDLVNAAQARRDRQEMENAWSFMTDTLPSRVNDVSRYVILNIAQRLAPNDIEGRIRDNISIASQYSFVTMPAQFDVDTVIVCPITGTLFEFKAGDFLWPERFGDYSGLRAQVGETVWMSQYLQKPQYSDSTIIKEDMIIEKDYMDCPTIDQADMIYGSHDFPVKDKETSDFLGSLIAYKVRGTLYITDCLEKRMAFVESINYVKRLSDVHFGMIHVIEDKANGSPILQQLAEEVAGLQAFQPGTASKTQRLESASYYMNNIVFIKNKFNPVSKTYGLNENLKNLKDRLLAFPFVEHDDICDAFSMLALFVFMDKRFSVYARAFNELNYYNDADRSDLNYSTIFFNKEGDSWKTLEVAIEYGQMTKIYVKRELQFKAGTIEGLKKLKEFAPDKNVFIDCSASESLYGVYQDNVLIERYTVGDFDKSVSDLSMAFANRHILIDRNCKLLMADIENFKFDKSKDENVVKYKTQKDGFVACLRVALKYYGGIV